MNTERIDVLAVLTPPPHRVIEPRDWKYDHDTMVITKATPDATPSPTDKIRRVPVYRSEVRVQGETPRTAIIDANQLDEVRAAIAELLDAVGDYELANSTHGINNIFRWLCAGNDVNPDEGLPGLRRKLRRRVREAHARCGLPA